MTSVPRTPMKKFVHPKGVYRLEYPAHWEQIERDDEVRSCGFGPRDRNDAGLWISVMPYSVDTERAEDGFPELMREALQHAKVANFRPDDTLRHYALKADIVQEGQGGHYWLIAGGDVVIFASTQVPITEREFWNHAFGQVLASLTITRDMELLMRRAAHEVLERLRERFPEEDFRFDEKGIRGQNQVVFLANLYREIHAAPHRRREIVQRFLDGMAHTTDTPLGEEIWDEVQDQVVPMLKPREYLAPDTPTQHLLATEWLANLVIIYAIKSSKVYRFLTTWDTKRWGLEAQFVHERSLENLARLPWPERFEGVRQNEGGCLILIMTPDGLASSRLLHPELHDVLSSAVGSPFWAGIPSRDTLVVFSDRRGLKRRVSRQLRKDHDSSAYPITPHAFLVTRDGIAPPLDH